MFFNPVAHIEPYCQGYDKRVTSLKDDPEKSFSFLDSDSYRVERLRNQRSSQSLRAHATLGNDSMKTSFVPVIVK